MIAVRLKPTNCREENYEKDENIPSSFIVGTSSLLAAWVFVICVLV